MIVLLSRPEEDDEKVYLEREQNIAKLAMCLRKECPKTETNSEGLSYLTIRLVRWKSDETNPRVYETPHYDSLPKIESLWPGPKKDWGIDRPVEKWTWGAALARGRARFLIRLDSRIQL